MLHPRHIVLPLLAAGLAACSGAKPIPSEDIRARAERAHGGGAAKEAVASEAPDYRTARPDEPPQADAKTTPKSDAAASEPEVKILEADPAKGCTWIDSKASVDFSETEAKNQAEARAVSKALVQAMHKFLGQELTHNFVDYQQEGLKNQVSLTESLLRVTQPGMELARQVLFAGPEDLPGCAACRYGARLRTCIAPRKSSADKGFRAELKLNRTRYVSGDPAEVQVTVNRDAYIYIYDIDLQANSSVIFPNEYLPDNRIRAGETFIFPSEEHRRKTGIKFTAELPEGADVSAEVIRVVASKEPLPKSVLEGRTARGQAQTETHGAGSFLKFMQRLNASGLDWAEDVQAFTIFKE